MMGPWHPSPSSVISTPSRVPTHPFCSFCSPMASASRLHCTKLILNLSLDLQLCMNQAFFFLPSSLQGAWAALLTVCNMIRLAQSPLALGTACSVDNFDWRKVRVSHCDTVWLAGCQGAYRGNWMKCITHVETAEKQKNTECICREHDYQERVCVCVFLCINRLPAWFLSSSTTCPGHDFGLLHFTYTPMPFKTSESVLLLFITQASYSASLAFLFPFSALSHSPLFISVPPSPRFPHRITIHTAPCTHVTMATA